MTAFVESLKRLLKAERIDEKQLNKLLEDKKITDLQYKYILNKGE